MIIETKVQYRSGMILCDEYFNYWIVKSSLDLNYFDKKRKNYLTVLARYASVG